VTRCTSCHHPITGISPDVLVCGYDTDVMHVECARKVMVGAFVVPSAAVVAIMKRGRR
jgi:hypothetical protein